MKYLSTTVFCFLLINSVFAQSTEDKKGVIKACLNYIDGFYQGDTTKIIESIRPSLHKFGFWKNKETGEYEKEGYMTFVKAKNYAKNVYEKKRFAKADAPRDVKVLDIQNHIAAARVTAWWGTDYILLTREGDKWMIEQVLWEGPLVKVEKEK